MQRNRLAVVGHDYDFHPRSLGAQLQELLGDRGTIVPHKKRGTLEFPARGWYAEIDGETIFLGDHVMVAAVAIDKLP